MDYEGSHWAQAHPGLSTNLLESPGSKICGGADWREPLVAVCNVLPEICTG